MEPFGDVKRKDTFSSGVHRIVAKSQYQTLVLQWKPSNHIDKIEFDKMAIMLQYNIYMIREPVKNVLADFAR